MTAVAPYRSRGVVALAALVVALVVPSAAEQQSVAAAAPPDVDARVETIVRPLAAVPSILTTAEDLVVELDATGLDPGRVRAFLAPSFGAVRTPVELTRQRSLDSAAASGLWPERTVSRLVFDLPSREGLGGLYDLHVEWTGDDGAGTDSQRRAVSIVDRHPRNPRVVVIADPSVGDPRPLQEGAEDTAAGDPESLVVKTDRTLGASDGNGRWGALKQVIDELNLVQPDFVLVAGDLTFAAHPRALPYEYEDAWELFDRLEVPAFFAPGNHDLYAFDDYLGADAPDASDGAAMWQQYFGPLYYSTDIGPSLHLVTLNTFDWPERMPFPPPEFDTLSGGQIRAEQFTWLRDDLQSYRRRKPEGAIVTLAHHDPSWVQARHPWPGERRLETRDLLAEHDVGVHFAGHTHEDRVARYHQGHVVQTNGRPHRDDPVAELSYLRRDNSIDPDWSQQALARILHEPVHGPLFVTTTTAASGLKGEDWGLGGYWGWRLADLAATDDGGYDPAGFGYPATRQFLDEQAERPQLWNADHAEFGLFSYPSYHLSSETLEGNDGVASTAAVRISSQLATALDVTVRVRVAGDGAGVHVEGGRLVRARSDGAVTDVWIATSVPALGQRTVTVGAGSRD